MMRCLTLAQALQAAGNSVRFVMARDGLTDVVAQAGFGLTFLDPVAHVPPSDPPHAGWLTQPWASDAAVTGKIAAAYDADWVIVDHYGLDGQWADAVRTTVPQVRILAMDDLDDRALGADLVLDPARMGRAARRFPQAATLDGPEFALLRPEFAELRPKALARRRGAVRRVLILPGMMDAAGLAPQALAALRDLDVDAEVVMGSASQSAKEVQAMVAANPRWTCTFDARDMARRMSDADLCIGAGGGTMWERCCLGLPTVAIAVADNQISGIQALAEAGAVVAAGLPEIEDGSLTRLVERAVEQAADMSEKARSVCDGGGAERVVAALAQSLRPVTADDARLMFDWRDQPHVRAASHSTAPLVWDDHLAWLARALARKDMRLMIYSEGARPLGVVIAADQGEGLWRWSFYIGVSDAPRGAGGRMLHAVLRDMKDATDARIIEGEVRADNPASARLHRRLGFEQVTGGATGVLVFQKRICDVRHIN